MIPCIYTIFKGINCKPPEEADNMEMDGRTEYDVGDNIFQKCPPGYESGDINRVTCLSTGSWSKMLNCTSELPHFCFFKDFQP